MHIYIYLSRIKKTKQKSVALLNIFFNYSLFSFIYTHKFIIYISLFIEEKKMLTKHTNPSENIYTR
jgi:hypothetical protein